MISRDVLRATKSPLFVDTAYKQGRGRGRSFFFAPKESLMPRPIRNFCMTSLIVLFTDRLQENSIVLEQPRGCHDFFGKMLRVSAG